MITVVFKVLQVLRNGLLGTYFTHAQGCDNLRVQSAAEWTVSVQNQTTRKREHFLSFRVFIFSCFSHLHAFLIASAIIGCIVFFVFCKNGFPALRVFAFLPFSRFRRFRVFDFSRFRAWRFRRVRRFRVFAFSCSAGGTPAAGTQISYAQRFQCSYRRLIKRQQCFVLAQGTRPCRSAVLSQSTLF